MIGPEDGADRGWFDEAFPIVVVFGPRHIDGCEAQGRVYGYGELERKRKCGEGEVNVRMERWRSVRCDGINAGTFCILRCNYFILPSPFHSRTGFLSSSTFPPLWGTSSCCPFPPRGILSHVPLCTSQAMPRPYQSIHVLSQSSEFILASCVLVSTTTVLVRAIAPSEPESDSNLYKLLNLCQKVFDTLLTMADEVRPSLRHTSLNDGLIVTLSV